MRIDADQYDKGLLLYGTLINNTETAQELEFVTGTFYDAQGQIIAGEANTDAYWPAYAVAPGGGSMPFELLVTGINSAADFDLSLEAISSSEIPRQDFEITDLDQRHDVDDYCVAGTLRNPGSELQDYLVIAVVLYDNRDNVVNFGDEQAPDPRQVVGEQTYNFEICLGPPNQEVVRYELEAWGL